MNLKDNYAVAPLARLLIERGITLITIAGRPGAGKGTIAREYLKRHKRCAYVEMSRVLKSRAASSIDRLGCEIDRRMKAGDLVPDELVNPVFADRIRYIADPTHGDFDSILVDGFPRSPEQEAIIRLLEHLGVEMFHFHIEIAPDLAVERMLGRGRQEETPELCWHRQREYERTTLAAVTLLFLRSHDGRCATIPTVLHGNALTTDEQLGLMAEWMRLNREEPRPELHTPFPSSIPTIRTAEGTIGLDDAVGALP